MTMATSIFCRFLARDSTVIWRVKAVSASQSGHEADEHKFEFSQ
jgi:hypothetical protein